MKADVVVNDCGLPIRLMGVCEEKCRCASPFRTIFLEVFHSATAVSPHCSAFSVVVTTDEGAVNFEECLVTPFAVYLDRGRVA